MRLRMVVTFIVLLSSATLSAQSNELGIFASRARFSSATATDQAIGLTAASIKFDSKAGYGLSFIHFVSPGWSIQLSGETIRANATVAVTAGGVRASEAAGPLELTQADA